MNPVSKPRMASTAKHWQANVEVSRTHPAASKLGRLVITPITRDTPPIVCIAGHATSQTGGRKMPRELSERATLGNSRSMAPLMVAMEPTTVMTG